MATKVTPISGFQEWLPADRIAEQIVLDTIREVFELHGFASINTRAMETVERLAGQGEDADKEIYGIRRLADPSGAAELGLHFDLTVPFARYVLENAGKLTFPFRRYQIQPAWRGERPQRGRYREFLQADIDIIDVGSLPDHYEAELLLVVADVFARLPIGDYRIHVNDRKICEGFYRGLGIEDVIGTLRVVDKLDKIGADGVRKLLLEAGCTDEQATQCLALAEISTADTGFVDQVRALGVTHELLDEGLAKLAAIIEVANEHAPGVVVADLRIARGLDYYTGTVYETMLEREPGYGSICSGGRYDALATDGKRTFPGVGISIGVSRLLGKLITEEGLTASRETPVAVLVAVNDEESRRDSMRVATALRSRGIPTLVAPKAAKFGKQIQFADRRGIPFVWFTGAGADEKGDQVKDLRSGDQVSADSGSWAPPEADLRPSLVLPESDAT
ncbi:histidine--tRNA ligase [Flexivirga endophytica]|uniref:Histidine--tRNA ligase n=1 Tax=Flexivirga endophytica TaxID=1849103 RepID=A0A916T9S8_9MICO|nr:histidine--tRNA ligase [Flexivirga endophytica]GGB36899.1 histidine--tRNA ligase [Flexivirga endophytica]GHB44448.1 histidine--tRNA ligase [Flexivirga endophytica]